MASSNPELQAKLNELDHELEEGDITRKGYEKRRTVLLSQYLGSEQIEQLRRNIESHSSSSGSNSIQGISPSNSQSQNYNQYNAPPPSHVTRFQEQQLGYRPTGDLQRSESMQEESSRSGTMLSIDYRFNPTAQPGYDEDPDASRRSTMLDSQQSFFSDFAGQQTQEGAGMRDSYGGPTARYSADGVYSPTANMAPPMLSMQDLPPSNLVDCQVPLEPREVPFQVYDPHNKNTPMSKFEDIGSVLRHRAKTNPRQIAYWVLDNKGKEVASITFEKLASRAEKVAETIKNKSNLYRGDRVALVYRDSEIIDFAVALLGCFLAGVVGVPLNGVDGDFAKLQLLLTTTQAHLALTTEENLKKFQRDISTRKFKWPTGVEWWKTNEFGSHHGKLRSEDPQLPAPDLAYIEFSRAPTGDLRGVVLSHRTIMRQMACLQAILSTIPDDDRSSSRNSSGGMPPKPRVETILSYLDPREGVGLILGTLLCVYGGHTSVWMNSSTVETPGLYANLITKYKTTVMVADYAGLMLAVYNYQTDPLATRNFKRNAEPNFSSVRICLIDTLTSDCEFNEVLADRWLKPLRNPRARELVAPILCLPEHGGMIISVRDWIGGEERMGCPLSKPEPEEEEEKPEEPLQPNNGYSSLLGGTQVQRVTKPKSRTELSEVLLDKEALIRNEVRVLAMGAEAAKRAAEPGTLRVGGFGFPIPDATLSVVDPETNLLCPQFVVGEIWVDSPSLSGGFWALPKHTATIFHARPYRFIEGNPTPVLVEPEFLRTGLLGCVIEGKLFILGLYEDRIRQRVEGSEQGLPMELDHRFFFVQHLVISIMKNVLKIYDCSAFDTHVNGEYLPIILLETQAASTLPTTAGGPPRQLDMAFLDSLSERVMDILYAEHKLRVYCVMVTAPNSLPRIVKNGRREIGNMLCRKEFENGTLACVHVKFGIERAVINVPIGDDTVGGIWSPLSSQRRAQLLLMSEKQYSGVDYRPVVIDDRTSAPLNQFTNIQDLMQYRVAKQTEELSYCTIDSRGREGKGVNWKKFDQKVAAVAMYLKNKVKLNPGDRVLLMYTHSEDFVYAVHACMCLGVVAIPMAPVDQARLNEDAPALLHIIADFKIRTILVNNDVDSVLKQKAVSQHLKQSATILQVIIPGVHNTSKPPKQNHGCRELGLTVRPNWAQSGYPVLVWVYWTPDQRRIAVQLGHDTIMALCKVQKETCQMTSMRPVVGCVRSTIGIGFVHTCLLGIYLGSPTYLVSPVDFAAQPNVLFYTLGRYKIKDTYATSNMLDYAMAHGAAKTPNLLQELKNLMISTETRPRVDVFQKVRVHFAQAGLDRTAINTVYSHVLNPMVTSRSYMTVEPIELWLDRSSLRRGLIVPVHPETEPSALLIQDSGMVPVSTQICVVNPESNRLCLVGEYGEIWVDSEANVHSFYGSKDPLDNERFNGRTVDGDPNVKYVRTGDLGFLHNVSRAIGPSGGLVEMQVLFVLGSIGETFEVNGLCHFPVDIESSVERCHRNIVPGGCAVFQAGGLAVVLVEVDRKNWLASIVPVIVNSVLNNHNFVVDIVAFVSKGDFPRSRLGEKQRGKILASWVTRKMRTVAQFAIRDPDADETEAAGRRRGSVGVGPRASTGSATLYPTGHGSMGSKVGSQSMPMPSGEYHHAPMRESMIGHPQGPPQSHSMPQFQPPAPQSISAPATQSHIVPQNIPQNLPHNEFHVELPATYPAPEELIPELPADEQRITPTASRRNSDMYRAQETPPARIGGGIISGYSPVDRDGPYAENVSPVSLPPGPGYHSLSHADSNPSLAKAAQGLPGSLLPPAAIADLRAAALSDAQDASHAAAQSALSTQRPGDTFSPNGGVSGQHPPPLPSYVNKPYLAMLTEEEGRQGTLPSSPPRGSGRGRISDEVRRPGPGNMTPSGPPPARSSGSAQFTGSNNPQIFGQMQHDGSSTGGKTDVANRDSTFLGNDDMEWPTEALMHMGIGVPPKGVPRRKDVGSAGSGR